MNLYIIMTIIIVAQALIIVSLLVKSVARSMDVTTSDHRRTNGASAMNPLNIPIKKEPNR